MGYERGSVGMAMGPTGLDFPALVQSAVQSGYRVGQHILGRQDDGEAARRGRQVGDLVAGLNNLANPAAHLVMQQPTAGERLADALATRSARPLTEGLTARGPTSGQVAAHTLPGADYAPKGLAGRMGAAAGYGLAGGQTAGPMGALRTVLPAMGGQVGAELAPEDLKAPAQVLGAILTGGVQGAAESMFRAPAARIGADLSGLSPEEIRQVTALRQAAQDRGINLSVPEAVQQVTNGSTGLGRLQRLLENNRQTQPAWASYYRDRPQQMADAVDAYGARIAPDMNPRPGMIALDAQRAAQQALDTTRRGINSAAQSSYDALPGQTIPAEEYATLHGDPAYAAALTDVRGNDILNGPIAHLPDNDLAVVNEVVKRLDRNENAARVTQINPHGDNQIAAANTAARTRADLLADAVSEDWGNARGIVAAGRRAALDPLEAGPAGKIASTADLQAQTSATYPRNPPVGASLETAEAVGALNRVNPNVARDLTRQHIANTYNQSARELTDGENQYGGALFAKNLVGNAEQRATLHAGLNAIDQSGALSEEAGRLADILQATGRRERPGSMTAFNAADTQALALAPKAVRFFGAAGDPLEWTKHISDWAGVQMGNRRNDLLSELLMNPDTSAVVARAQAAANGQLPALLPPSYYQGRLGQ